MKRILLGLAALIASPAFGQSFTNATANPAVSASMVVSSTTTYLTGVNVVSGASAGYVMLFDANTVPADGAVTPLRCLPVAANTGLDLNFRSLPLWMRNGAVVVFSTTGCYTKTASATAFIAGDAK